MIRLLWIVGFTFVLMVGVSPVRAVEFGTGWNEAYWNGSDFVGAPLISRALGDRGVNFDWGMDSPDPIINVDNWVGRFASANNFLISTVYEFVIIADGGVRVLIDNVVVFDEFYERPLTGNRIYYAMEAGIHQLQVQYFNGDGAAQIAFFWQPAGPLIANGDFSYPIGSKDRNWAVFSHPTDRDIVYRIQNGIFEFYRMPAPPGGNSAVVLQDTHIGISNLNAAVDVRLWLGNISSVRKRATILMHEYDFSDFFACSFWIPPNKPLQEYRLVGSPTTAWTSATLSIYASNPDGIGWMQVDNVSMSVFTRAMSESYRTLCYDPETPPLQ